MANISNLLSNKIILILVSEDLEINRPINETIQAECAPIKEVCLLKEDRPKGFEDPLREQGWMADELKNVNESLVHICLSHFIETHIARIYGPDNVFSFLHSCW